MNKGKREKTQITKIRNKSEDIIVNSKYYTDTKETQSHYFFLIKII